MAVVGVSLLILAIAVVLITPPADGYEISLYNAYPVYFWIFVVGAMFVGALVVIESATLSEDRTWISGLILMLLTDALLLLLPFFRGYAMYGHADPMTHIGLVKDIMNVNSVGGNIYPPVHLLALVVEEATGIELMTVAMLVPIVFSVVFFGGMFYLLVYLFDSRQRILLGLPIVMLPILNVAHVFFRPFDASLMLLPFVVYLWVKSRSSARVSDRSVFVVAVTALLLYHPLTGLLFTIVTIIYILGIYLPYSGRQSRYTNIASLTAAVFVSWYSIFSGIILRFESVYRTFFGLTEGEAPVESYQQTLSEASPQLLDLVRVALFRYGVEFALFSLGSLSVLLLSSGALRRKDRIDVHLLALSGGFVLFGFGGLAFLLSDLIVPPSRSWQFAKICAAVLAGGLIYYLYSNFGNSGQKPRMSSAASGAVPVIMLVLVLLSVFSFYPSPLQSKTNHQVTEMELEGTQWVTEHGDETRDLLELGLNYYRYFEAQEGTLKEKSFWGTAPPDHFNYPNRDHLGANYENDQYLLVTREGRVLYPEMFENYRDEWRYTPSDFDRLERDRTVDRIYDNGEYNQYSVEGTGAAN